MEPSERRRVALVVPPVLMARYKQRGEYLGVGYLGAVARAAGHDVSIVDAEFQGLDRAATAVEVLRLAPDLVGLAASYVLDLVAAARLASELRERGYPGLVVVGGVPATASHAELLEACPDIDVVVRGEAEQTFLELLEHARDRASWANIAGIAYREHGQVRATAFRPPPGDLDALPRPLRENTSSGGDPAYLSYARANGLRPFAFVASSRGCPFRCTFCGVSASSGRPWRARSADDIVDELSELASRWNIRNIRFVDDNFLGSCRKGRERAEHIARLIVSSALDIEYTIECCAQDVERRLFSLLRRSGLRHVNLGLESGSEHGLRVYGKIATVDDNRRAIEILNELGLRTNPNFILIHPDSTLEELRETAAFLRSTRLYRSSHDVGTLFSNRLGVLHGTPICERLAAEGRILPWRYHGISAADQHLADRIGNMVDYAYADERIDDFLRIQRPAISELLERQMIVDALQAANLDGEAPPPRAAASERWLAGLGPLALRQLTEAIAVAETRPSAAVLDEARRKLCEQLDLHDRMHFGALVRELERERVDAGAC